MLVARGLRDRLIVVYMCVCVILMLASNFHTIVVASRCVLLRVACFFKKLKLKFSKSPPNTT
jgi:hypothetical protein